MKEKKFLVGVTEYNELVFVTIRIKDDNEFSAVFEVVSPIEITEDLLEERANCLLDCFSGETKWDLVERFDCTPSELPERYSRYAEVGDLIDISLYPENFYINGKDIYFESGICGQCGEYLDRIVEPVNDLVENLIPIIKRFWTNYHLKIITDTEKKTLEKIIDHYINSFNEREWVKNWLKSWVR